MKSKKFILVETSYPINSRNLRLIDSLKEKFGFDNVKYIAWNRDGSEITDKDSNNYIFCRQSPFGDRISKLKNLWAFRRFLRKSLNHFSPDVIIASHWDSLVLCASLIKKRQSLIYENLDMPTGNKIVFHSLRVIERMALKRTDAISYASRFYQSYYKWFKGKHFILENKVPESLAIPIKHTTEGDNTLTIAFNGGLRYAEIFKNLFNAIGDLEGVKMDIYGGNSGQGNLIMRYAEGKNNITFQGAYNYEEIPDIYSKMDIVWAVYPANNFNVKYAISNKYHESIFYGVPGVFAKNTKLGELVENNNAGYQVDGYSIDDIKALIIKIRDNKKAEIEEKRYNMKYHLSEDRKNWTETVSFLLDYLATL